MGRRYVGALPDPVTGRQADQLNWGANAIFDIVNRKLVFRSYYKMPAVQANQENCVAHLPSLIPVPGRDILVQAWYQAGASVMDFTDSANPKEIGYYDRGPISGRRSCSAVSGRPITTRCRVRLRDRPRLRRLEAQPERRALAERDRRRGRGAR